MEESNFDTSCPYPPFKPQHPIYLYRQALGKTGLDPVSMLKFYNKIKDLLIKMQ